MGTAKEYNVIFGNRFLDFSSQNLMILICRVRFMYGTCHVLVYVYNVLPGKFHVWYMSCISLRI